MSGGPRGGHHGRNRRGNVRINRLFIGVNRLFEGIMEEIAAVTYASINQKESLKEYIQCTSSGSEICERPET